MRHRVAGFLVLCAFGGLCPPAGAAVRRWVAVEYERGDGSRSDTYTVEATFVTGRELNKRMRSYRFNTFSDYALFWLGGRVTIIELDGFLVGAGGEFDADDFRRAFRFRPELPGAQENAPGVRNWYLHAKRLSRWIDPRAVK